MIPITSILRCLRYLIAPQMLNQLAPTLPCRSVFAIKYAKIKMFSVFVIVFQTVIATETM